MLESAVYKRLNGICQYCPDIELTRTESRKVAGIPDYHIMVRDIGPIWLEIKTAQLTHTGAINYPHKVTKAQHLFLDSQNRLGHMTAIITVLDGTAIFAHEGKSSKNMADYSYELFEFTSTYRTKWDRFHGANDLHLMCSTIKKENLYEWN